MATIEQVITNGPFQASWESLKQHNMKTNKPDNTTNILMLLLTLRERRETKFFKCSETWESVISRLHNSSRSTDTNEWLKLSKTQKHNHAPTQPGTSFELWTNTGHSGQSHQKMIMLVVTDALTLLGKSFVGSASS
jgi:hypothetical protein